MLRLAPIFATLLFPAVLVAQDTVESSAVESKRQDDFVGHYDGGSFETAMGMVIRDDGTFSWGLSVGALDLRASGSWERVGETIVFTSDPKPIAPAFSDPTLVQDGQDALVRVVWSTTQEPFQYASIFANCANGETITDRVGETGWSPPAACDRVTELRLVEDIYDVTSNTFSLTEIQGRNTDLMLIFEFQPNDLGVLSFDGSVGSLADNVLTIQGPEGTFGLEKLPS